MEKLSRVMGLRVLAIKEGIECGDISQFVVDSENKSIRFVVIDTGKGCFGLQVLPIETISGMGQDYATTATIEAVTNVWETEEAMQLAFTNVDIVNARVVSSTGDVLGKIVDFEFNPENGIIETYIMEDNTQIDKASIYTLSRGIVFVDRSAMDGGESAGQTVNPNIASAPEPAAVEPEPEPAPTPVAVEPEQPAPSEPEPVESAPAPGIQVFETQPEPEPAPEKPAPAPEPQPEQAGISRSYFDKRRSEFLTGKTLKQDILDDDGKVLAEKGAVIDEDIIAKIKEADKMVELTMSVN